jgi:hypothetical protein
VNCNQALCFKKQQVLLIEFTDQDEPNKEFEDFSQEPSDSGVEEEIGGDTQIVTPKEKVSEF